MIHRKTYDFIFANMKTMKTVRFFLSIAINALLLISCQKIQQDAIEGIAEFRPTYTYLLSLSFKSTDGTDLMVPLWEDQWKPEGDNSKWAGEINPKMYKLDIILSNPHESWDNTIYNFRGSDNYDPKVLHPSFQAINFKEDYPIFKEQNDKEEDGYRLFSLFHSPGKNGLQEYLTYKITCPTIFGDNSVHEIIAYWDNDSVVAYDADDNRTWAQYPDCIKAVFDGREILVKKYLFNKTEYRNNYVYFIDIVLNK